VALGQGMVSDHPGFNPGDRLRHVAVNWGCDFNVINVRAPWGMHPRKLSKSLKKHAKYLKFTDRGFPG
jgi:hypothetical protein